MKRNTAAVSKLLELSVINEQKLTITKNLYINMTSRSLLPVEVKLTVKRKN